MCIRKKMRESIKTKYNSINNFCKVHNLNQSDINKFLVGRKDFTLSKLILILEKLDLKIELSSI
jgi:predicted XRE-type DNA-binding protein